MSTITVYWWVIPTIFLCFILINKLCSDNENIIRFVYNLVLSVVLYLLFKTANSVVHVYLKQLT